MATITWPAKWPKPTLSYTGKTSQNTQRTPMDTGRVRQTPRFTTEWRTYSAKWVLDNTQFEMFQAWVKYKLKNGADFFNIALPVGGGGAGGVKTVEARLVNGAYTFSHKGVLQWEVSATLETPDVLLPTESALDTYLAS